jgi:hypothetical protein
MAPREGAHIRRMGRDGTGRMGGYDGKPPPGTTTLLIVDCEAKPPVTTVSVAWGQRHWLSGLDSSTLWVREGPSVPLLASSVKCDLAIHHNRHEPVIFCVLELHNLMTAPRQSPPATGLLRVLLDRLIFVPSDCERCSSQVPPTRMADTYRLAIHTHRRSRHQLRGNRL